MSFLCSTAAPRDTERRARFTHDQARHNRRPASRARPPTKAGVCKVRRRLCPIHRFRRPPESERRWPETPLPRSKPTNRRRRATAPARVYIVPLQRLLSLTFALMAFITDACYQRLLARQDPVLVCGSTLSHGLAAVNQTSPP